MLQVAFVARVMRNISTPQATPPYDLKQYILYIYIVQIARKESL